ncbi:MAG: toll/interleukin-1 receptor domain-containing protein [Chloroflexi bacterium]|nr:toll/interleukin-1 receptor domain-containing protein [Chloroflexota bacterium]
MSHIFISYSKKNHDYAQQLADKLVHLGFGVWLDARVENHYWAEVTKTAVQECAAFVILMSPDAMRSRQVQKEVAYAKVRHKPIIPLLLDGKSWTKTYINVCDRRIPDRNFFVYLARHAPHTQGHGRHFEPADVLIEPTLRFHGVYSAQTPRGQSVLRFFEDGRVLEYTNKPNEAPMTFDELEARHHRKVNEGRYEINGRDLVCTFSVNHAKVTYEGTIDLDTVEFRWYNYGTKKRGQGLYQFIPAL